MLSITDLTKRKEGAGFGFGVHTFDPSTLEQREVDRYEFQAGLSLHRIPGQPELQYDPISKNKRKKTSLRKS